MNINYLEIGKRIRTVRQKRGITQEKLAEMVEAGTTHISHIETGNTIPSIKMFIAIVNALDVSADELLCDSLEKSKYVYQNELTEMTQNCSENEMRVIVEMVKSIKFALRRTYETKESV
jgi:Predicted transcriptional regulators